MTPPVAVHPPPVGDAGQEEAEGLRGRKCITVPAETAAPTLAGRGARQRCSATCHAALARQHANNMLLPRRFVVTVTVIVI